MASASGFSLASASSTQVPAETVRLVTPVKTLSIRRPIGDAPEAEAERPVVTASLGKYQAREPGYEQQMAVAPMTPRLSRHRFSPRRARARPPIRSASICGRSTSASR
jgi:hypothetical protein